MIDRAATPQSEASFRSFFETPAVGVVQADIATGRLLRVNQKFCQISGYPCEELAEMTFLDLAHLDDREAIWEGFQAALRSESAHYLAEKRLLRKGGDVVWVRVNAGVLSDPDGTVTQATVVVEDITEHKRAEEELRVQSRLTETVINNAAEALFLMNAEGLATYANPAAEEMFGWTLRELAGTKLHDSIHSRHPDGRPYPIEECPIGQSFVAGQTVRNHEDLFVRRDGSFVPVLCSMAPIHHDGVVTGAVLTVTDITNRKRAEDAIRASEERLLRTERIARAEAERSSRLKDEFLATISHELRTPLNAILGWAQILGRGGVDAEKTSHGLSAIERNARAQAQLIDDLLDMSRIISGKIRLEIEIMDLRDVIAAATETIRPAAEAKGIQIQQTLDPLAGPVRGDANRLQQVVWNLLSNAVKFTPPGGRVQVTLRSTDGGLVEVTVTDTGQGIEPEFLPFVYDRFRQADGSTTRQHGGLGLGLAIVKQLVELHGGRVRAQSSGKDQGASFLVELPSAIGLPEREPPRIVGTPEPPPFQWSVDAADSPID